MPVLDGWRLAEPHRPLLESEMNQGNVRSRPVATLVIGIVEMTLVMRTAQYNTFRAFVRDDLERGSVKFNMPVYDGVTCPTRVVRLRGGAYTVARSGSSKKVVSFSLDVDGL
jgi:hypothetical protein